MAIVEFKMRGSSDEEAQDRLHAVKREVAEVISKSHGLRVADLVLVPPGFYPDHYQRQGPPLHMRRMVSARRIHPTGHARITSLGEARYLAEDEVRQLLSGRLG